MRGRVSWAMRVQRGRWCAKKFSKRNATAAKRGWPVGPPRSPGYMLARSRASRNTALVVYRQTRILLVPCAELLLALGLLCCSHRDPNDYIELPPLPELHHRPLDAGIEIPEGATLCKVDAECDDGVDCTDDICVSATYCRVQPVPSRCSDGLFCTGFERCDTKLGCQPAYPVTCADQSTCTMDHCDEELKSCVHDPRDIDADGEVDWHCAGGTDCDDSNPAVSSRTAEACGDGIDNDCDELIDEKQCGRPEHDDCGDALDISAGGQFDLAVSGAAADYMSNCNVVSSPDVALVFELDEASDVTLTAQGQYEGGGKEEATLTVRTSCADSSHDLECVRGFPSQVRMRALAAGRYYVVVHTPADRVKITASFSAATAAPSNMDCSAPMDLGQGMRVAGDFVDVSDNFLAPCGLQPDAQGVVNNPQPDLAYQITTMDKRDLVVSAVTPTNDPLVVSVRSTCDDAASTLLCVRGYPATLRLHELPPGSYFIIVESPSYVEADFELDVRLEEPTKEPEGDSCKSAAPLKLDGSATLATLAGKQPRVTTSCDQYLPDYVYQLSVADPTDLVINVSAGGAPLATAMQVHCGKPNSDLACYLGAGGKRRFRNLAAGEYALVIESYDAREVAVSAELLPVTVPLESSGNDTCKKAFDVPADGGVLAGSTAKLSNDYVGCGSSSSADAVYRLELKKAAEVRVTTEAEFDTVLYRFDGTDKGADACDGTYAACNDDADGALAGESELDEKLQAGIYYYIVDGFSVGNEGAFYVVFDVM